MKTCSVCFQSKVEDDFNWRNKSKGKRHGMCKECSRKRDKKCYTSNPERRQKLKARSVSDFNMKRDWYNEYKASCVCAKCNEDRTYMLDFHHVDRDLKSDTVFRLIKQGHPLKTIQAEVAKCIPLCANHHREFHHLEEKEGITLDQYLA